MEVVALTVIVEQEKIYGPLGQQVEIENLPSEFMFFADEDIGSLVHIPCGDVVAQFGSSADSDSILNAARKHEWCPALGAGISSG